MRLVLVAAVAAVAVIVYRSRHGVEIWHTIEEQSA